MKDLFADIALCNIDDAIQKIDSIKDNTMFEKLQLSIIKTIYNAVHSIVDYYERVDKSSLQQEEDVLFRAFMYVNNQIKHDKNLQFVTYNVSGSMFPFSFPFRFGSPGVAWKDFPDNGSPAARGKRKHYVQMLMKKDVKKTFTNVKDIITKLEKDV